MAINGKITGVTPTGDGNNYTINFYDESTPGTIIGTDSMSSGGEVGDLAVKKYIIDKCRDLDGEIAELGTATAIQQNDVFAGDSSQWYWTVVSGINQKITNGTIEKGTILEIDEERELAVVSVYMIVATVLYNRQYLVYSDKDSAFKFEQIVQE